MNEKLFLVRKKTTNKTQDKNWDINMNMKEDKENRERLLRFFQGNLKGESIVAGHLAVTYGGELLYQFC